jgi:RNA polymerase sigma factor (sigma-70 family)
MDSANNARIARILEALVACQSTLRAFIRRRIPVRADVDDILQDVTLQLINVEQPIENVSAWLFRAARNEMIDRSRKKQAWLFSDDEEIENECRAVLFNEAQTPEEARLSDLFWDELERALSALPPTQREVFEKTALQNYSFKQLAEETGLPVQTLLSRKHKAVRYLRNRLSALYHDIMLR